MKLYLESFSQNEDGEEYTLSLNADNLTPVDFDEVKKTISDIPNCVFRSIKLNKIDADITGGYEQLMKLMDELNSQGWVWC